MLADNYYYDKNYTNAIKAYKKLMLLAWKENDAQMEIRAFAGLALQYFYKGDMQKCNFLTDRVMRGKRELSNSKLRLGVMKMLKYST